MSGVGKGLHAANLCRDFVTRGAAPRRAVDHVDLDVAPGELVSVLGPNGAGKTTTVRMLTGLLLPTSGTATVAGFDVVSERRRASLACGFSLGGESGLYPRLTALQNLTFFGMMYGLRGRDLDRRAHELLDLVDLADRGKDIVGSYSRGMKQRLHLARALVHDPDVLILDEPSAGLDPQSAATMRSLVRRLSAHGRTILLTTHDMREAEELSDRVVLMQDGRVRTTSTAPELRRAAAQRLGHTVRVEFVDGQVPAEVAECPGLLGEERDAGAVMMRVADGARSVEWVLATFPAMTLSVAVTPPTLEEAFLDLVST